MYNVYAAKIILPCKRHTETEYAVMNELFSVQIGHSILN